MKKKSKGIKFLLGISAFFLNLPAQAGAPLWTFEPVTGFPPVVSVAQSLSATVKYTITNQSKKTHTLVMTPIAGISQNTSSGNCGNPFILTSGQSCTLTLEVQGSALSNAIVGGPVVCQQGGTLQCYQPSPANRLNISKGTALSTFMAAGSYQDNTFSTHSLLILSSNGGLNWSFPESITTPVFTPNNTYPATSYNILTSVSCSGILCVAGGLYIDTINSVTRPMLALSNDLGLSWAFPESITAPVFTPTNTYPFVSGAMRDTSCVGSTCIAGGTYSDGLINRPLVAVTNNSGASWSYPESITDPVFTPTNTYPFTSDPSIYGTTCSENVCFVIGSYSDNSSIYRPLLARSVDSGQTWSFPTDITDPVFTPSNTNPYVNNGDLYNANCTGSSCIVIGSYISNASIRRPLLGQSSDLGATWTFPQNINSPVFVPTNTYPFSAGSLQAISCSGTLCVAVGSYTDNVAVQRPLVALSNNSGLSWSFPEAVTNPIFTPANTYPFVSGQLNAAACTGTTCIIGGDYFDGAKNRPLLFITRDSGATWTAPESITAPIFTPSNTYPFDVMQPSITSVRCSGNNCMFTATYTSIDSFNRPLVGISNDLGVTWSFPEAVTAPVFTPNNTYPFFNDGILTDAATSNGIWLPAYLRSRE